MHLPPPEPLPRESGKRDPKLSQFQYDVRTKHATEAATTRGWSSRWIIADNYQSFGRSADKTQPFTRGSNVRKMKGILTMPQTPIQALLSQRVGHFNKN